MGSGHNTSLSITHHPSFSHNEAPALLMIMGIRHSVSGQDDVGLPAGSDAILSSPYVDSFSCEGQAYGYFADVQNNCEVFHICYPLTDETGRITEYLKWSFFCGNGTVFDQEALVCNHPEDAFPCEESPSLYGSTQYGLVEDDLDYY